MCFVDLVKAFDRVSCKLLEWAMRKKGMSKVLFTSVMSLYVGARTRVRVNSGSTEELEVNVEVYG